MGGNGIRGSRLPKLKQQGVYDQSHHLSLKTVVALHKLPD